MLTLDPVVKVNLLIGATVVVPAGISTGLIIGPSRAIPADVRLKSYNAAAEMLADGFTETDAEYQAAVKYFGVTPMPSKVMVACAAEGESATQTMSAIREKAGNWYGVYYCGATDAQVQEIDTFLIEMDYGMQFYGNNKTASEAAASGLFKDLYAKGTRRAVGLLTPSDAGASQNEAAALMGAVMGYSEQSTGKAWQLCYKRIEGCTPIAASQQQVEDIEEVNGNIYVARGYSRQFVERGATANGVRADEMIALDTIKADIQEACLALMTESPEKLPQNDTTTAKFTAAIATVLEAYYEAGILDKSVWHSESFGNINVGDVLEHGYSIHAESFDEQTVADRQARKAMPITVGLCLCGAVETIVINVNVQQ